jgi:hypothetical protein
VAFSFLFSFNLKKVKKQKMKKTSENNNIHIEDVRQSVFIWKKYNLCTNFKNHLPMRYSR